MALGVAADPTANSGVPLSFATKKSQSGVYATRSTAVDSTTRTTAAFKSVHTLSEDYPMASIRLSQFAAIFKSDKRPKDSRKPESI